MNRRQRWLSVLVFGLLFLSGCAYLSRGLGSTVSLSTSVQLTEKEKLEFGVKYNTSGFNPEKHLGGRSVLDEYEEAKKKKKELTQDKREIKKHEKGGINVIK